MRTLVIVCMWSLELATASAQERAAEGLAEPVGAGYWQPVRFPDVRLERALEDASHYDLVGQEERALATIEELASDTSLPPVLWDEDTARAVARGLGGLDNPYDQQAAFYAGIVLQVIGGLGVVGTLVAALMLAFQGLSCRVSYSCTAPEFPGMTLIGTGVGGGTVLIFGFLVWLLGEEVFNSGANHFEERRGTLRQRVVADIDENEPGVLFPAFGRTAFR